MNQNGVKNHIFKNDNLISDVITFIHNICFELQMLVKVNLLLMVEENMVPHLEDSISSIPNIIPRNAFQSLYNCMRTSLVKK